MNGESQPATSGIVDPAIEPTQVLSFEPLEARELSWLPLAVRYKLDRGGLRLGLESWRSLELDARRKLVACSEGEDFVGLLRSLAPTGVQQSPAMNGASTFSDFLQSRARATRRLTAEARPVKNLHQ